MNSKLPPHPPGPSKGVIRAALAVALILSPLAIKAHMDQTAMEATVREYRTTRSQVLTRIDTAMADRDLSALRRIQSKYAGCVKDAVFKTRLDSSIAQLAAREALATLNVSKHLDVARHQEELSIREDPTRPQLAREDRLEPRQRLSVLPH